MIVHTYYATLIAAGFFLALSVQVEGRRRTTFLMWAIIFIGIANLLDANSCVWNF